MSQAERFQHMAIAVANRKWLLATWIDNLYAFSASPSAAIDVIDACDSYLQSYWKLKLKPSSKFLTSSSNDDVQIGSWQCTPHQEILGIIVSHSGECAHALAMVNKSLWKNFFAASTRKRMRALNNERKVELLDLHLFGHLAFRATAFPPSRRTYDAIDQQQRNMILCLIAPPRRPDEDDRAFHARRHNIAATFANKAIRWSDRLLLRAHAWQQHLERGHVPSPAASHAKANHAECIKNLRLDYIFRNGTQSDTLSAHAGRFGMRLSRGRPPMRWEEGLARSKQRLEELLLLLKSNSKAKNRRNTCKQIEGKKAKLLQNEL